MEYSTLSRANYMKKELTRCILNLCGGLEEGWQDPTDDDLTKSMESRANIPYSD
jgi:hypothetical protein